MAFLGITFAPTGLVSVNPPINYINTTDSLTTITTPGYLNNQLGNSILLNQCVNGALCATSNTTNTTTMLLMTISSSGVITLSEQVNPGNVTLPVTSGDFAVFNGNTGIIKDAGYIPTNPAKTKVVMANGAVTVNNLPIFTDTNGTIGDSGIPASSLVIESATVTLTASQVNGAYATPVQLLAAPGTGVVAIVVSCTIYTVVSTAFTAGGVGVVQYGNTVHGGGTNALAATIPSAEITAAASQVYVLNGNTGNALTGISSTGLYFSNQTQAFATGTNSGLSFVIQYYTLPATV